MVSSLIGVQYNNDQFWKFSAAAAAGEANNFDTPSVPAFSSTFEVRKTSNDLFGSVRSSRSHNVCAFGPNLSRALNLYLSGLDSLRSI